MTTINKNTLTELHLTAMRNSKNVDFIGLMEDAICEAKGRIKGRISKIIIEHIFNTEFTEAALISRKAGQVNLAEILDDIQVKMVVETKRYIQVMLLVEIKEKAEEQH